VFKDHPELLDRVIAWADEAVAGSAGPSATASLEASPTP
jgi:hypothetical protein